jgi:hypothetical protein
MDIEIVGQLSQLGLTPMVAVAAYVAMKLNKTFNGLDKRLTLVEAAQAKIEK